MELQQTNLGVNDPEVKRRRWIRQLNEFEEVTTKHLHEIHEEIKAALYPNRSPLVLDAERRFAQREKDQKNEKWQKATGYAPARVK